MKWNKKTVGVVLSLCGAVFFYVLAYEERRPGKEEAQSQTVEDKQLIKAALSSKNKSFSYAKTTRALGRLIREGEFSLALEFVEKNLQNSSSLVRAQIALNLPGLYDFNSEVVGGAYVQLLRDPIEEVHISALRSLSGQVGQWRLELLNKAFEGKEMGDSLASLLRLKIVAQENLAAVSLERMTQVIGESVLGLARRQDIVLKDITTIANLVQKESPQKYEELIQYFDGMGLVLVNDSSNGE